VDKKFDNGFTTVGVFSPTYEKTAITLSLLFIENAFMRSLVMFMLHLTLRSTFDYCAR